MTWSSTTIASCLSTRRVVTSEKVPDPSLVRSNRISHPCPTEVADPALYTAVALSIASPVISTGPSWYLVASSRALKTTFWSLSASNEHSLVACSVGVPQVSGLEAYAGSVGLSTPSTSRCSRRAVSPITWSRRSWPVSWSLASAASRSRKHPRFSPAELTTQNWVSAFRIDMPSSSAWASSCDWVHAAPRSLESVSLPVPWMQKLCNVTVSIELSASSASSRVG